jgi:hypothetical protein
VTDAEPICCTVAAQQANTAAAQAEAATTANTIALEAKIARQKAEASHAAAEVAQLSADAEAAAQRQRSQLEREVARLTQELGEATVVAAATAADNLSRCAAHDRKIRERTEHCTELKAKLVALQESTAAASAAWNLERTSLSDDGARRAGELQEQNQLLSAQLWEVTEHSRERHQQLEQQFESHFEESLLELRQEAEKMAQQLEAQAGRLKEVPRLREELQGARLAREEGARAVQVQRLELAGLRELEATRLPALEAELHQISELHHAQVTESSELLPPPSLAIRYGQVIAGCQLSYMHPFDQSGGSSRGV